MNTYEKISCSYIKTGIKDNKLISKTTQNICIDYHKREILKVGYLVEDHQ